VARLSGALESDGESEGESESRTSPQRVSGQSRPHTITPPPQSCVSPTPHVMSQPPPEGQRSKQPAVLSQVAWQPPPSHVVSQPPVPVHAISDAMPTWNEQGCVLVHVAVQSTPHAALQPAPVHATAQ
jgi:hypothetical protein